MAKSYSLTKSAVRSLRDDHQRLRTELQNLEETRLRYNNRTPQRDDLLIAKAAGAVAARSGATAASGDFTVQAIDGAGVMTDTAKSHTVFNVGDSAISSGDYVPIERDYKSARWVCRAGGAGGGGAVANLSTVKAQEYWQHSGTLPSFGGNAGWVSVKLCDSDGTGETGAAFDCYLTVPFHMDPNVVVDQLFIAAEVKNQTDSTTFWYAVTDVSDLAVGSVKMMTGNLPTAAHGWAAMDGTQDATKTASGTAIDFTGRVPLDGAPGTAAGTVSASTTTGSTTPDTVTSSADGSDTITSTIDPAATVTTSAVSLNVQIALSGIDTEDSATGIEGTDPATGGGINVDTDTLMYEAGGEELEVVTDVSLDDDHSHEHGLTDPEHHHAIDTNVTGVADAHEHTVVVPSHAHDVVVDDHTHQVPGDAHTHTIEQMGSMTVQFYERIDNSGFA